MLVLDWKTCLVLMKVSSVFWIDSTNQILSVDGTLSGIYLALSGKKHPWKAPLFDSRWSGDLTLFVSPFSGTMTDRKAVIKNADMSEDMQQDAVDCATQAMEKYNIEKDIAAFIKKVSRAEIWAVLLF